MPATTGKGGQGHFPSGILAQTLASLRAGPLASTSFANVAFFASAKHVGAGINEATDIQVARLVLPQSGEESPSSSSASPNWRAMWSSSTGLTASIEDGPPRSRIEVTCRPW